MEFWPFKKREWKREFKLSDYMRTQLIFMKMMALWPINYHNILPKKLSFMYYILNFIYYVFWLVVCLHIVVLNVKSTMLKWGGSLDDLSPHLMTALIYSFSFFIALYFEIRYLADAKLVDYINNFFLHRSASGITYITIEPSYRSAKNLNYFWCGCCTVGALHWAVYPIMVGKKILPLDQWYPFDPLEHYYLIVYIGQFLGQSQIAIAYAISGGMYLSMVILTCGQYDILFASLKNIRYTAMLKQGNKINELKLLQKKIDFSKEELNQYYNGVELFENLDDFITMPTKNTSTTIQRNMFNVIKTNKRNVKPQDNYLMEYNDELSESLGDCVRHHQIILKFCQLLEHFFYPYVLIKLFQVTFLICFLAYIWSTTEKSLMKTINLAEYLYLTTSELFFFCYLGEILKQQSMKVGEALLRSPWHLCGGPFRRGLSIILSNTMRPVILTAGKFYILDFERFKAVIGASFSYYTLLQNMESNKK